jgi:hypothetical protein
MRAAGIASDVTDARCGRRGRSGSVGFSRLTAAPPFGASPLMSAYTPRCARPTTGVSSACSRKIVAARPTLAITCWPTRMSGSQSCSPRRLLDPKRSQRGAVHDQEAGHRRRPANCVARRPFDHPRLTGDEGSMKERIFSIGLVTPKDSAQEKEIRSPTVPCSQIR